MQNYSFIISLISIRGYLLFDFVTRIQRHRNKSMLCHRLSSSNVETTSSEFITLKCVTNLQKEREVERALARQPSIKTSRTLSAISPTFVSSVSKSKNWNTTEHWIHKSSLSSSLLFGKKKLLIRHAYPLLFLLARKMLGYMSLDD